MNPLPLLKEIFGDDGREFPFATVTFLRPEGSEMEVLFGFLERELPAYNKFSAEKVISFLRQAISKGVWHVRFGREYSPVLYITLSPVGKGLAEKDLMEKALELDADEVDFKGDVLRIWWD